MKEILSNIHARFRQLRNGEVVDNLAAQGVTYRIAWGLESYRLKEIAEEVLNSQLKTQNQKLKTLAEALWAEDVRESKMLATRLYPIEEFTQDKAKEWIKEAKYTEIADQLCMNLLAKVPFAEDLLENIGDKDNLELYCALKLATRIEKITETLIEKANKIIADDAPIYLKTAALWYKQLYEQS